MEFTCSVLEHSKVPIQVREVLTFTRSVTRLLVQALGALPQVSGAVLLSTCNRTEVYISSPEQVNPGALLCQVAGVPYEDFASSFETYTHQAASRHLLEVAAGLRSRVWGEDQIISQVKDAILLSRESHAADPFLETLFRTAISAGKEVRSVARLTALPTSAASRGVEVLEKHLGSLQGKRAMVIGNGEMGRLAATILRSKGCAVTVTLRTYHHGETIVPSGCTVTPYDGRYAAMEGLDFLLSATTSPHYTVTVEEIEKLPSFPPVMMDLSIPRDLQPELATLGITLFNVDDLADQEGLRSIPPKVEEILRRHLEQFFRWENYKDCLPALEELKQTICQRVQNDRDLEGDLDQNELIALAVSRSVDLLAGGLSEQFTAQLLKECSQKIRSHTRGKTNREVAV